MKHKAWDKFKMFKKWRSSTSVTQCHKIGLWTLDGQQTSLYFSYKVHKTAPLNIFLHYFSAFLFTWLLVYHCVPLLIVHIIQALLLPKAFEVLGNQFFHSPQLFYLLLCAPSRLLLALIFESGSTRYFQGSVLSPRLFLLYNFY